MEELILKQEREKFDYIEQNFSKDFLHRRFTQEDFLNKLESFKLCHSWDKKSIKNKEEEAVSEGDLDYSICIGVNEDWGYIDVYYLYDLRGEMLITEITISKE